MGAEEDGVDQPVFLAAEPQIINHLVGDIGRIAVLGGIFGRTAPEALRVGRRVGRGIDIEQGFGHLVALPREFGHPAGQRAFIERRFEPEAGQYAFEAPQARIVGGHVARIGGAVGIAEENGIAAGAAGFKREIGVAFVERRAVADRAVDEGIEPGEQRRPRRTAGGRGGIMVAEENTIGSQLIEIGGQRGRVAKTAKGRAAPLIDRDKKDLATGHTPFPLVGG